MGYRVLFFCFLLVLGSFGSGWCDAPLEVTVQGVEGKLLQNVMARLRINLFSRDSELNEVEIRRLHRLAPEDISSALSPYGYYSVSVDSSLKKVDDVWKAVYRVELGDPVHVKSFSISIIGEGIDLPELAAPDRMFGIKKGDDLDQTLYEQDKRALLRKVRSLGFLDATYLIHQIRIDRKHQEAEIELVLDTGPRYLYDTPVSDQNIITDALLERYIPFKKGDYYIQGQLYDLQRDLYRTDYFSSVSVAADPEAADGLYIPVSIDLQPLENYNSYSLGIGYATDTRAHVRFEWQNRLLNKKGHRTFSSLLVGERMSHCVLNYRIPTGDPRFNTITGTALWNRELWEETVTNTLSAGAVFEYSTPKQYIGISLEGFTEDYSVGETKGKNQLLIPAINGSLAIADDIVSTENGVRSSIEISGASENFFSDATFLKVRTDGKLILSPLEGWRLIGRGSLGAILVDSINDIPPTLRFYAGGSKSVRGYRYRSLGPTDTKGNVNGGKYLMTGSIEGERRLSEYWRAVAFYDVGNAMNDLSVDLVHGIGFGVGLALPFGQARMEFAYPLHDEGSSQYFYISVGADL